MIGSTIGNLIAGGIQGGGRGGPLLEIDSSESGPIIGYDDRPSGSPEQRRAFIIAGASGDPQGTDGLCVPTEGHGCAGRPLPYGLWGRQPEGSAARMIFDGIAASAGINPREASLEQIYNIIVPRAERFIAYLRDHHSSSGSLDISGSMANWVESGMPGAQSPSFIDRLGTAAAAMPGAQASQTVSTSAGLGALRTPAGWAGAAAAMVVLGGLMVSGETVDSPDLTLDRRISKVDPALSADSDRARRLLMDAAATRNMQDWRAHHRIPFAVVAGLPVDVQRAIVASGWRMDSIDNLIALPADWLTYVGPPNVAILPMHSGSHPKYSLEVAAQLAGITANYRTMTGPQIHAELTRIQTHMGFRLLDRDFLLGYHPRVN